MSPVHRPAPLCSIPALLAALLAQPAPTLADPASAPDPGAGTAATPQAAPGALSDQRLEPPPLMLAEVYRPGIAVSDYWVSETLDGVRAYWDGARLISRGGHEIRAPAWFTAGFPPEPLDGELWLGRNKFARLAGIVKKTVPVEEEWRQVRFMIFELPGAAGSFTERIAQMRRVAQGLNVGGHLCIPVEAGCKPQRSTGC